MNPGKTGLERVRRMAPDKGRFRGIKALDRGQCPTPDETPSSWRQRRVSAAVAPLSTSRATPRRFRGKLSIELSEPLCRVGVDVCAKACQCGGQRVPAFSAGRASGTIPERIQACFEERPSCLCGRDGG
jgi:hypothetical protein